MTERDLQAAVLSLARLRGWLAYHTYDSRRSAAGFPDLVLVHPKQGRLVFAELKSETGRLTPEQGSWLGALRLCGVPAYLWRPVDWVSGEIERVLG